MIKNTVVILQDDEESVAVVKDALTRDNEFEVIGTSCNGQEGYKLIKELRPHFAVVDLVLSGEDGLSVIEKLGHYDKTKIIVLSAISNRNFVQRALNAGAIYFFIKPTDMSKFKDRVKEFCGIRVDAEREFGTTKYPGKNESEEAKISNIFLAIGIPPHIMGYNYLREGVKLAMRDPTIINSITKRLYPKIGERFLTSSSKVERAIRHAIDVAWSRGKIESLNPILGVVAYNAGDKPTNGEFIALIADKMLLDGLAN